MSCGLISKSVREVWAMTLLCGLGVMVFEVLLAHVLRSFETQLADYWLEVEFIRNMVRALLGSEITEQFDLGAMSSIAWVHPVILAILWAHEITLCTRVPAGEVDRGTIDVLFGLPVSRWGVYLSESLVWIVAGVVVIGMGWLGSTFGYLTTASEARPSAGQTVVVVSNLYCLYLAVGGLAFLTSSLSDRRGRAVAVAFTVVVTSFLLSFLAQYWEPAKSLSFLSMLHYYKPLLILREAAWPMRDMVTLIICAAVMWLAGGLLFARRDICTV
jgi:ABC-type transport system involved in multi-copper enzyme maturation permease subunit